MFTANVGSPDRLVRLILGLVLVALPFLIPVVGANVWLLWALPIVGAVLMATAFVAWCPIYAALRLSTRSRSRA